ncbi:MAG TPA: serine/threonine-protein kinase [Bryobacteraceae bacterium]|nr:serine/threonine-protein kinase [Bryobacteraceae bacterium]
MSVDRWQRIESLFETAAKLPPEQWEPFLREQCPQDDDLCWHVLDLLRDDDRGDTISNIVREAAISLVSQGNRTDQHLGPYRILRPIGKGGMGAVFLAVRDDDQYRKEVAIKTLRFEATDSSTLNRFRHERQVLAGLEHPNIARLLDGGTAESGLPYIVMEYIAGVPVTQYCRERGLSIEARVELFRQVCDGVQYAHQRLVVHRDIKPENILVTEEGVPKLVDFGIAKLLDPTEGADVDTRTMTGLRLMTPAYASPEQILGQPVSTATDVYSLGAVLYELLTGTRAHVLKTADAVEAVRIICESPVKPPSTVGLRGLRGDLDNIVLKAMQRESTRRYQSAGQFSEDLGRFLRGLPVSAQPDSIFYRTRKYVRRHWLGVSALAAVAISLSGGAIAALYQARLAQERFLQVRKLANRVLFDFDDRIRTLPGSVPARELLVQTALEYLDNLSRSAHSDPGLQWELAKAYEKVGDVQGSPTTPSLGRSQSAADSYRKALAIQEDLLRRGYLDAAQRESFVQGYLRLAAIYVQAGTGPDAVAAAKRGIDHAAGLSNTILLRGYATLAHSQWFNGQPLEAIETAKTVLPVYAQLVSAEKGWSESHAFLASLDLTAGRAAARVARFEQASDFFQQGIAIIEPHLADGTFDPVSGRSLVLLYHAAGDILGATDRFTLGRPREAEPYYRKALALAERLAASDSGNATLRLEVARSAGKLASVLDTVKPDEAIRLYETAQRTAEALLPEGRDRREMVAAAHASIAVPLAHLGRVEEARARCHAAIAIYDEEQARHPALLTGLNNLSDAWKSCGDIEQEHQANIAIAHYRKALDYAEKAAVLAPRDFAVAFRQHSAMEALAGALAASESNAEEVAELRRRLMDLWNKWDGLQPQSPFIQEHLRRAKLPAAPR